MSGRIFKIFFGKGPGFWQFVTSMLVNLKFNFPILRHIFDAENLITVCQITAHDSVLAAVRFNPEGNKLATGSEKVLEFLYFFL